MACALVCLLLLTSPYRHPYAPAPVAHAQADGQYRAFWVDTYNTRLNTAADVTATIDRARSTGANALFVQVRRRGDAWYLQGREPRPEGVAIETGFDPLAETLAQGHAAGLEIHAFVVVGAIWNQTTLPSRAEHVFSEHGFTPAGPRSGAANWLTRTRLPDGPNTSFGGYRFGSDFWLDFGHPDAATYTVDVLANLVSKYDIDGLHLDRLQYPEIGSGGGEPNVGYNDVSLDRFRRRYQRSGEPSSDDGEWSEWRRAQITALMRRIYVTVASINPRVKVSVGAVATGSAPSSDESWRSSDAYARAFQDWRGWLEAGDVDLAVPLVFRAEHTPGEAEAFAGWVAWTRDRQYERQALIGVGAYLNSIEGTLRQIRRATEPASNRLDGVVLYSIGAHNAPVTRNPLAVPAGRDTPVRSFEDLASGLRTGRTVAGQALEAGTPAGGVFGPSAATAMALNVTWGHVMGTVKDADGRPVDSADVVLESETGRTVRTATDGSGFYGAAHVGSGAWRITIRTSGDVTTTADCSAIVSTGRVARVDLELAANRPGRASCAGSGSSRRP